MGSLNNMQKPALNYSTQKWCNYLVSLSQKVKEKVSRNECENR